MEQNMNLNDMGRIWLSRKILHWQHFGQPSYLTVFITLLLVANHREQWWKGVKVNRGETVISVKAISVAQQWLRYSKGSKNRAK